MSTENLKPKQYDEFVTSSNISSYIRDRLQDYSVDKENSVHWKLYDKNDPEEDGDQVRAVFGICFMIAVLFSLGCFSLLG